MSGKVRVLSVAVVLVCLTAGSASALPLAPQPILTPEPGGIVALWDWFVGLFDGDGLLWEKAGSQMDPNGKPGLGEE